MVMNFKPIELSCIHGKIDKELTFIYVHALSYTIIL